MPTPKSKRVAKKAVSWASAIVSALRDPAVKEVADAALKHHAKMVAERSAAAKAERLFNVISDPKVIAVMEVAVLLAQKQLSKKG